MARLRTSRPTKTGQKPGGLKILTRWKLILLALFLAVLTLAGERGGYRLYQLKKVAQKIRDENRLLQEENNAMIDEIAALQDSDYVERLIREQWGYIKEGETLLEMPRPTPNSP